MATHIATVTGTNTATLGSHQSGDMFIAFAFRDGSGGAPTVPTGSGWAAAIDTQDSNNCSFVASWLLADGASEVAGTWTNATSVEIQQWRPGASETLSIGAVNKAAHASNLTVNYPGLTLQTGDGTSFALTFMGHRANNLAVMTDAPTGMVNRGSVQDATDSAATHSTSAGVASWTQQSVTYTGSASAYQSFSVELKVATAAGPVITGFDDTTPADGAAHIITGTGFGASQGAGSYKVDGDVQSVTAWAATEITALLDNIDCFYDTNVNAVVTDNNSVASAPSVIQIAPPVGWYSVVLTSLADPANRLTSTPDLQIGWQIAYGNFVGVGTATVDADGSYNMAATLDSFDFKVNDTTGWGATATVTRISPNSSPLTYNLTFALCGGLTDGLAQN